MDSEQTDQRVDTSSPTDPNTDSTSWKEMPLLVLKGFFMGSADIVPGVSGGTMALILGIYNRLLHAIKSVDWQLIKELVRFDIKGVFKGLHWKFLIAILGGIFLAIAFFTKVVPLQVYMHTHPELVFGLFFGLIGGSIYVLIKAIEGFKASYWLAILAGVGIGYWVVTRVPTQTPENMAFVFMSGAIAICAMILPGISGSYILLILRKYDYILSQVNLIGTSETVQGIVTLVPFFIGAAVGLAVFSRILSWFLNNYYNITLSVLIGFLVGSLFMIWPYQVRTYDEHVTTQVLPLQDQRVQELMEQDQPRQRDLPEYHRLGEIVNPDAELPSQKRIEYQEVKRKLIKTDPYVPYISEVQEARTLPERPFWLGIAGMLAGLVLVGGLERLR